MFLQKEGKAIVCLLLVGAMLLGCSAATTLPSDTVGDTAAADTGDGVFSPDPQYSSDEYIVMSKEEYLDKTTAGFLAQLAGFLSGHEFTKSSDGKCTVAMPDSKFEYLGGLYAKDPRCDKHIKHVTSGLWEVWFDDDFSVDVVNQYILSDMYRQKYTISQNLITEGWINYDVWDMGGGQRKVGAYGLFSRYNYLPQFAGNTEFDNWYSYLSEPYLGTDTLGMNAPGMPERARELAEIFAQTTGDRDNVLWAQMFATMISRAYFENDIKALIDESCKVFPDGSWPLEVVSDVYEVYEKYPNDWRSAYKEFEAKHYVGATTSDADTDINCGFVLLDLLYGEGDYMQTCKIGSLAGYDCESTCGIALAILGVMNGTEILPEETNTYIWQDGEGVLVNLVCPGDKDDEGVWMIADGLAERIKITKVLEKYQKNFEYILLEQGGAMDEHYYYIPRREFKSYTSIEITNSDFETGNTDGFITSGGVGITTLATTGNYALKLTNNGDAYTTVSGLELGQSYALTVYARTTSESSVFIYARGKGGANAVSTAVTKTRGTEKNEAEATVKRTLVFEATASEMEIGARFVGVGEEYAIVDSLVLVQIYEESVGEVKIKNATADNAYNSMFEITVQSEKAGQAYLKLTFANPTSAIMRLPITINYRKYATAGLYKTAVADSMASQNTVYIPVTLIKGENVISSIYTGTVYLYEVEVLYVGARS